VRDTNQLFPSTEQSLELEDKNIPPDYRTSEVPVVTKHHALECCRQGDCFNVVTEAD